MNRRDDPGVWKVAKNLRNSTGVRKYPGELIRSKIINGADDKEIANTCGLSIETARRFMREYKYLAMRNS